MLLQLSPIKAEDITIARKQKTVSVLVSLQIFGQIPLPRRFILKNTLGK
jgi:hypothetical protein